jgi:hypothetical protein
MFTGLSKEDDWDDGKLSPGTPRLRGDVASKIRQELPSQSTLIN